MNADTLLENFKVLTEAPIGIELIRELILDLAVRGDLVVANSKADAEPILWNTEDLKLDPDKLWQLENSNKQQANGWSRVPLARLGTWGSGGTPSASRKDYYVNGTIPWAVIGDLNNGVMVETSSKITRKALDSSSTKMVPKNAVLIAMYGASIGKTSITGIECCTNQAIAHCIVDVSIICTEYFFLIAKSLKKHLIKVGKGAAQPNISQTVLKHLTIDVPQLDVQKIIVAKVDELMGLCDELEQQQRLRDNLRTATRKSAIDAISTATTPEELETAWKRINNNWDAIADTPESIEAMRKLILDLHTTPRIDQGDFILKLGQVVQVLNGDRSANYPSKEHRVESGIPFINAGHLQNGDIDMSEMDFITPEKFQSLKGGKVQDGDILFCLRGSLGKCAIVRDIKEGTVASSLAILRPNEQVNSRYLLRFLQSGSCGRQIKKFDNGSAQPNLAAKSILNFELYLPALSAQNQVVKKIDELMALCDQLEARLKVRSEVAEKFARSVVSAA